MRNINFLCILLVLCLFVGGPADAKARRTPGKKTTQIKKVAVKPSGKKAAVNGKTGKRRVATPVARRAPRQSEPTPERYMAIQQALVDKGYHPGPVSGQWGAEWVTALKQFQQEQNLNPDGKLGALSLIALGLGPKREPMAHLAGKPESDQ